MRTLIARLWLAALALCVPAPVLAQQDVRERVEQLARDVEALRRALSSRDSAESAAVRRQIEALTREIETLRLGADVAPRADSAVAGLGPAASKVYRVRDGVSIGGYGEVLYQNFAAERQDGTASGQRDQVDALRAIVYVGYKFDERFLFNSEIEFEHGSTDQAGSVSVEFAYLDMRITPGLGARAGLLLVPMGFINELHEPLFLGTTRPATESAIIPTTWRENGVGLFGDLGDLGWRAYVINGLDAVGGGPSRAGGFSASGLRGGRQKGSRALIEDPAVVVRADYVPQNALRGLTLGASAYVGNSGQGATDASGRTIGARTTIWEGHAQYRAHGLDLRGLYARAALDDVEALNAARGLSGAQSIGEALTGGYLHAGYDLLFRAPTTHELIPYVRWERIDTQAQVPAGASASPANDRTSVLLGAAWKPITNIIVKADYQRHTNRATSGIDQFNVVLGYIF